MKANATEMCEQFNIFGIQTFKVDISFDYHHSFTTLFGVMKSKSSILSVLCWAIMWQSNKTQMGLREDDYPQDLNCRLRLRLGYEIFWSLSWVNGPLAPGLLTIKCITTVQTIHCLRDLDYQSLLLHHLREGFQKINVISIGGPEPFLKEGT